MSCWCDGTNSNYNTHLQRNQEPCDESREAHRLVNRQYDEEHRELRNRQHNAARKRRNDRLNRERDKRRDSGAADD